MFKRKYYKVTKIRQLIGQPNSNSTRPKLRTKFRIEARKMMIVLSKLRKLREKHRHFCFGQASKDCCSYSDESFC